MNQTVLQPFSCHTCYKEDLNFIDWQTMLWGDRLTPRGVVLASGILQNTRGCRKLKTKCLCCRRLSSPSCMCSPHISLWKTMTWASASGLKTKDAMAFASGTLFYWWHIIILQGTCTCQWHMLEIRSLNREEKASRKFLFSLCHNDCQTCS